MAALSHWRDPPLAEHPLTLLPLPPDWLQNALPDVLAVVQVALEGAISKRSVQASLAAGQLPQVCSPMRASAGAAWCSLVQHGQFLCGRLLGRPTESRTVTPPHTHTWPRALDHSRHALSCSLARRAT